MVVNDPAKDPQAPAVFSLTATFQAPPSYAYTVDTPLAVPITVSIAVSDGLFGKLIKFHPAFKPNVNLDLAFTVNLLVVSVDLLPAVSVT